MTLASETEPFFAQGEPSGPDGLRVGVLLSHGFTGSPASIVPWGRHLAAQGFAVAVPRLPGHGTTWQDMNRTGWQDWYDEIDRAFDKLLADCDSVVVGGLSLGGALALRLAEQRGQEVAGLVVVNPGLSSYSRLVPLRHVLKHVVPSTPAIKNDIKKPGQDELAYDRVPTRAASSMVDAWQVVIEELPKVTQPLLMFRSAEDHVVPPSSSQLILRRVSSRDVSERILENSYHVATLDNDAPAIFEESVQFIRRVTRP
ncbi:MAG: alpha/beta hydrolase [Nocardioidaceae bacterium]